MDVSGYQHSDSITIDRTPAEVYAIVSDVTRMGELSPVCKGGSWDDESKAATLGSWFTGHNAIGDDIAWDTHCEVVAAEPGREFAFVNHGMNGDVDLVHPDRGTRPGLAGLLRCWARTPVVGGGWGWQAIKIQA